MHGETTIFTLVTIVNLLVLFVASTPLTADAQGTFERQEVGAIVGQQVMLPCNSNASTKADWSKDVSDTNKPHFELITSDGVVQNGFVKRFSYTWSEDGWQNLTINSTQPKDAGVYRCRKDGGFGGTVYVQLYLHVASMPSIAPSPSPIAVPRDSSAPVGITLVKSSAPVETSYVTAPVLVRSEGSSGLSVTDGLLVAILTVIIVGLVVFVLATQTRNCIGTCRRAANTNNDHRNNDEEMQPLNGNEMNAVLAPSGHHLQIRQTIEDRNLCYFSELNGIYCMVDRSGNFTIYKQNSDDNGNCSFDKMYDFPSVDHFTPSGFTASKRNECFYVGDRFKRCVFRITLQVEDKLVKKEGFIAQIEADNEYPLSLSSLPDGRIAVLVAIDQPFGRKWLGRIEIYLADRKHQITIRPPNYVVYPWCAVYTGTDQTYGNDTFALTYGSRESGVIRLDSESRPLAECTLGRSMIMGMKYDKTNNSIYVVDHTHCRILQMDLTLVEQSVIHDFRGPSSTVNERIQPVRLNLNSDATYMSVGFESGHVSFYRFERPNGWHN